MIFRFQPFATDKSKFGEVYNTHCSIVPNSEDWIQLTDWDCMPLLTEQFQIIDKAIERYPDTAIFGAICNRVGYSFQRLTREPCMIDSIKHHTRIAEQHAARYSEGQCKETHSIAGFFMLFRKSFWQSAGGFQDHIINERGNLFDYTFCKHAAKIGKKIRIIEGLYLWHTYRLMQENYKRKDHLKINP